jgi:hypothetical protein
MTMTDTRTVLLLGPDARPLAELAITDEEEGWLSGRVLWQRFPPEVARALAWYDEVVQDQMLSYLDEAAEAVERLGLQARLADGSTHPTFRLHVSRSQEVSFRISPVLPPPVPSQPAR